MTQRIRQQAQQVWQALSGADTRQAYGTAVAHTWTILRESSLLLWLLACLVLVAFDAGAATAIAAGRTSRTVMGRLGEAKPDAIAANAKQTLLTAGKTGLANTLTQAREQLRLPQKAVAQPATATRPEAAVKPGAAPAEETASEVTPSTGATPAADSAAAK
ncbi:MAG: hypothetical protein ACFB5Z_01925 [Elainellaceae cyanobacterium]